MQYLLKSDGFKLELQYEEERHSEIKLGVYVFSKGFSANAYMDVSKTAWEKFLQNIKKLYYYALETVDLEESLMWNKLSFKTVSTQHYLIEGNLTDEDYYGLRQNLQFEAIIERDAIRAFFTDK